MESAVERDEYESASGAQPSFLDYRSVQSFPEETREISALHALRSSMITYSRMLFARQIDGRTYLELMANAYEQIRRVLMKALEEGYPESFFRSYAEVFSDPAVTKTAVFLIYNHKSFGLSLEEAKWCGLVLQGNVADAGPPPVGRPQPSTEVRPKVEGPPTIDEGLQARVVEKEPAVAKAASSTTGTPGAAVEVQDEFTEIANALRVERDRLPERERHLVYLALLAISYCRGKVDRSQLVNLGNEYLDKAVGLDAIYLGEARKALLRRLASMLKGRNVPSAIIAVFENPEILSSGRRIRIQ
ncbi:MAG: hypothetical protein ABDH63_00270 [Candidatus Caldarchaeales archaeon]